MGKQVCFVFCNSPDMTEAKSDVAVVAASDKDEMKIVQMYLSRVRLGDLGFPETNDEILKHTGPLSAAEVDLVRTAVDAMTETKALGEFKTQATLSKMLQDFAQRSSVAASPFEDCVLKLEGMLKAFANVDAPQEYENMQRLALQYLMETPTADNIDFYLSRMATDKEELLGKVDLYLVWPESNILLIAAWIRTLCNTKNEMGIVYANKFVHHVLHDVIARPLESASDSKRERLIGDHVAIASRMIAALLGYGTSSGTSARSAATFGNRCEPRIIEYMICTAFNCSSMQIAQWMWSLIEAVVTSKHGASESKQTVWKNMQDIFLRSSSIHECLTNERGLQRFAVCPFVRDLDRPGQKQLLSTIMASYYWRATATSFALPLEMGLLDPVFYAKLTAEMALELAKSRTDRVVYSANMLHNYLCLCTALTAFPDKTGEASATIKLRDYKSTIRLLLPYALSGELASTVGQKMWLERTL